MCHYSFKSQGKESISMIKNNQDSRSRTKINLAELVVLGSKFSQTTTGSGYPEQCDVFGGHYGDSTDHEFQTFHQSSTERNQDP